MEIYYFFGYPFDPGSSACPDSSSSHGASHRLRAHIPSRILVQRGHSVQAISEAKEWLPDAYCHDRRLIISKISHPDSQAFNQLVGQALTLQETARKRGIPVLVDYTDDLVARGNHCSRGTLDLLRHADSIVCSSEPLAGRVRAYLGHGSHVHVIPDPVEGERNVPRVGTSTEGSLRLLWFGHSSNLNALISRLEELDTLCRETPLQLEILTALSPEALFELQMGLMAASLSLPITISEWTGSASVAEALARSEVVVLPVDTTGPKAAASNNRLSEAFWGGCFVVASPIASYAPFAETAWLGDDLSHGIRWYLEHPSEAYDRIVNAQELIVAGYTPDVITDRWEQLLSSNTPVLSPPRLSAFGPKLNLGCGNHLLPGYLNIDIVSQRAGVNPDLSSDIRNLFMLPDDFAEEVLAVHVIEHFWRWEVASILLEWIRVLRPGGRLILECPNLLAACEALLAEAETAAGPGPEGSCTMWVFYGDPAWQDPLMTHKWGYTPHSLKTLLAEVGLEQIQQEPAQFKLREPRDMRITAVKPVAWIAPPPDGPP